MNPIKLVYLNLLFFSFLAAPNMASCQKPMKPPIAQKKPHTLEKHGHRRNDEYYWLRERDNPEVIDYLNAENRYTQQRLHPTETLQKQLVTETKKRIKQTDQSAPYIQKGYTYFNRTQDGKQYPIYCRVSNDRKTHRQIFSEIDRDKEQPTILLDLNKVAAGHNFCELGGFHISPDNRILAYAVDDVGRRKYQLRLRDIATGNELPDVITDVTGNFAWAQDNEHIFYTRQDPDTLRWNQIFRHRLGTPGSSDVLIYQEDDEEFSCEIRTTRSRKYLIIESTQSLSTEARILDAKNPTGQWTTFLPREENHEYQIDHINDQFVIRTNWQATNFRLMSAHAPHQNKENWTELVPASDQQFLQDFELFNQHLVLHQIQNGLAEIRYRSWDDDQFSSIEFEDPCYEAELSHLTEPEDTRLRYTFSTLRRPKVVSSLNMLDGADTILIKQQEILGDFEIQDYRVERIWATSEDGAQVPISLVYHKSTPVDGTAPCLLYGYGSYGYSMPSSFDATRLNLINRGFVYAIGHIRGGQELGRQWYDDGKLLNKKNTFNDFIACGQHLIQKGYSAPNKLYARGGSAGGLLMGAVINQAPELFDGVIANVPFVDVVTTMLDETIPLTTSEYDEWGNPNELKFYDYMLSYSPYDQVTNKTYPNLLVTTGLHDSQVQYWEPAKWVARLRDRKADNNLLLLKTNMEAGHGGASGRYDRYQEVAERQAFILFLANRPH